MDEPSRGGWRNRLRRSNGSSYEYVRPVRGWAPNGLFYAALVLFIVLAIIALSAGPLWSILLAIVVLAAAFLPRHLRRDQLINDLFQRTRKITREEEYEADLAQDRRRFAAILRGDVTNAVFRTYFENVRKTVRPGKYIQIQFTPLTMEEITSRPARAWLPQREDVIRLVRHWPPLFEPQHQDGIGRLKRQVEAFLGEEVEMDANFVACHAVFMPKRLLEADVYEGEMPDSESPTSQF